MNTIFTEHLLSIMIAMPFVGIAIIACIQDQEWIRRVALGCTLGDAVLSLVLLREFDFFYSRHAIRGADGMDADL